MATQKELDALLAGILEFIDMLPPSEWHRCVDEVFNNQDIEKYFAGEPPSPKIDALKRDYLDLKRLYQELGIKGAQDLYSRGFWRSICDTAMASESDAVGIGPYANICASLLLSEMWQCLTNEDRKECEADLWNVKADEMNDGRRWEQAIKHCDKALELEGGNFPMADVNKGIAQKNLGQLENAVASYDRAIRHDPEHKRAWANKANALGQLGRLAAAAESLEKALKIDPKYPYALEMLETLRRHLDL